MDTTLSSRSKKYEANVPLLFTLISCSITDYQTQKSAMFILTKKADGIDFFYINCFSIILTPTKRPLHNASNAGTYPQVESPVFDNPHPPKFEGHVLV